MTWMQSDGFADGSYVYDDGPYFSVNWTDDATLQSAISRGPVKIGVAADQIEIAWGTTGGQTGWFGTGFHADGNEDHRVALCGFGPFLGWRNNLASKFPRESTERSPAMRCSRGTQSASSALTP